MRCVVASSRNRFNKSSLVSNRRTTHGTDGSQCVAPLPFRQKTSWPAPASDSLSITPSSPDEKLVSRRTSSIGSKLGPQVTITFMQQSLPLIPPASQLLPHAADAPVPFDPPDRPATV